jgi:hypothetical protein
MTNLRKSFIGIISATLTLSPALGLSATGVGMVALLTACKKEEPPPPPPPPPPPAPRDPDPVSFDALKTEVSMDARVSLANDLRIYDRSLALAGLEFASAFAAGADDFDALGEQMTEPTRQTLDDLVGTGDWFEVMDQVEAVRIVEFTQDPDVSTATERGTLYLAIQEPGVAYVLGWDARKGAGDKWVWSQAWSTPNERTRASDWDDASSDDLTVVVDADSGDSAASTSRKLAQAASSSDKAVYVAIELTIRFQNKMGAVELPMDQLFTRVGPTLGISPDEARSQYDSGKQAIEDADSIEDKIDPLVLRAIIDGAKMQMGLAMPAGIGEDLNEDSLFELLAEILDETPAKVREAYDNAAP